MFDPSTVTIGQVSSTLRDLTIVTTIILVGWYSRGWFEAGRNFFTKTISHMESMESFARVVVDNHLLHIEHDLKLLSGRKDDFIVTRNVLGEPDAIRKQSTTGLGSQPS